jgi:hypothetical protein
LLAATAAHDESSGIDDSSDHSYHPIIQRAHQRRHNKNKSSRDRGTDIHHAVRGTTGEGAAIHGKRGTTTPVDHSTSPNSESKSKSLSPSQL